MVGIATGEIAKLQKDVGTNAEVIIDSGNVPQLLNRAAEQTRADLLIVGHIPAEAISETTEKGTGSFGSRAFLSSVCEQPICVALQTS